MKTKTIELFTFAELTPEAQKSALDYFRDINVHSWNDGGWAEPILEGEREHLEALGYIDPKIYFSGFNSQGDGACFDAKMDMNIILKRYEHYQGGKLKILDNYIEDCDIEFSIVGHDNMYVHERTRRIDLLINTERKNLAALAMEFQEELEKERLMLCTKIYKALDGYYFELCSDEAVRETIEANEYYFTADGKLE